jgi:hypothetical protein
MNGGLTGQDWIGIIMASNEAALQWGQLFTGRTLPGQTSGVTVTDDRVEVGNGGLILLGILALGAFLLLKD